MENQNLIIDYLEQKGRKIITGGDGRCNSPGYLAKCRAYLITDMDACMVLTVLLLLSPFITDESYITQKTAVQILNKKKKEKIFLNHCDQL